MANKGHTSCRNYNRCSNRDVRYQFDAVDCCLYDNRSEEEVEKDSERAKARWKAHQMEERMRNA